MAVYFQDDEDFSKDEVTLDFDQIKSTIDRLMRLSLTVRNPASFEQFKIRAPELVDYFVASDLDHVQNKFPKLHEEVKERLGKALTHRRLFFRYREQHNSRLNAGMEDESHAIESRSGVTTEASWQPKDMSEAEGDFLSKDNISDISVTSYAPSSAESGELRVPRIPPEYVDGPFQCPYCWLHIVMEDRYHWKSVSVQEHIETVSLMKPYFRRHVFTDLRPYICLAESCSSHEREFQRRKDWFRHMLEHCRLYYCPFGCLDPLHTPTGVHCHVTQRHAAQASSESLETLSYSCSRIDHDRLKGHCPLCHEVDIQSSRHYQSHVANHLEQLALFVLPDTGGEDSEVDVDQPGIEDEMEQKHVDDEDDIDNRVDKSTTGSGLEQVHVIRRDGSDPPNTETKWYTMPYVPLEAMHVDLPGGVYKPRHRKEAPAPPVYIWKCVSQVPSPHDRRNPICPVLTCCKNYCGHGGENVASTLVCVNCGRSRV